MKPKTLKKTDARARHATLCNLIAAAVEAEGKEHRGYQWAIKPRQHWADALGVDAKTITRLIQVPPIWTMRCQDEDPAIGKTVQAVALRVGDPPERTPEHVASIMATMFRKHTGKDASRGKPFGCLVGLAELWPQGHQERIFADLLKNWPQYMAAIKLDPEYDLTRGKGGADRYLRHPSIPVIRRFHRQVPDYYLTRMQLAEKPLPFAYAAA